MPNKFFATTKYDRLTVEMRELELLKKILINEGNGTLSDENGRIALHHVVLLNDMKMLSLLLKWNMMPINAIDKFGFTALSYSIISHFRFSSSETFYSLSSTGADPTIGQSMEIAVNLNLKEYLLAMQFNIQYHLTPHMIRTKLCTLNK